MGSNREDTKAHPPKLLGDYQILMERFPQLESRIQQIRGDDFNRLRTRGRFRRINETLLDLIKTTPAPCFLLPAVIEFIDRVNQEELTDEPYRFADFEFWLINFAELSEAEAMLIRAKVAGKQLPREDYQAFFPIGMGKEYPGSHFISAHTSPDTDTLIASFFGWLDAFSARVGTAQHIWSLPGGAPSSHITSAFKEFFGTGVFDHLIRASGTLTLNAMDLLTQQGLERHLADASTSLLDHGPNKGKAIVYVDEAGHFLGDWRSDDVEATRLVVAQFNACMRWFENNLHSKLISLFGKADLKLQDVPPFVQSIFDLRVRECEPARDLTNTQRSRLHDYLYHIFGMTHGLNGSFGELIDCVGAKGMQEFSLFRAGVEALQVSDLFGPSGSICEDRPAIFHQLERIILSLDAAIQSLRNYVDRLDVMMDLKHKVLRHEPIWVTLHSDVEEMRAKMGSYDYLTVVVPERDGTFFPVGVVPAKALRKEILGTVTLRDFCNFDEVKMASYLEVISVVDHHKSTLRTSAPPAALIGDAQSCNVLIAEQEFILNDRYSLAGMDKEAVEDEVRSLRDSEGTQANTRLQQRILQRRLASGQTTGWVHPAREFLEYLCFLYAILDDTDLLSKVSSRDVACVGELLNRLKTLSVRRDVEIVHFDDIPRDRQFAKKAAQRILKNDDMYSLYKKIYAFKEEEVEQNLELCVAGESSNVFSDTKEQNGCGRVGQTKLFASNIPVYLDARETLRRQWLEKARKVNEARPELDFHLHMVSTITGADEVYHGDAGEYNHRDEIWIWIPETQLAREHLAGFLNGFKDLLTVLANDTEVEFLGPNAEQLQGIFHRNFGSVPRKTAANHQHGLPIAVLSYKPGTVNSRKSQITPYIPKLVG